MESRKLLDDLIISNDKFSKSLRDYLKKKGMTIKEFSEASSIPPVTLYKLTSGKGNFNIDTIRKVYKTINELEGADSKFIAVITSRDVFNRMNIQKLEKNKKIRFREYPSDSIENIIISAIKAEKEGAVGVICGPIAASLVEKVVQIPICSIKQEESGIKSAVEMMIDKLSVP